MADITVTTDFSQVNNLKESLQTLPPAYARVVDSVLRENNRLNRLLKKAAKDGADINKLKEQSDARYAAQLQKEADKRERIRAREAKNAEKEAQRIEAANQKQIASEVKLRAELEKKAAKSAQNFQAQVGPNLGLGAQGISASASGSAFEAEIERLRTKYDGIYASSQLYEKSLNEINQAHLVGAISEQRRAAAVESLNQEYQNFQNGIALAGNRFAKHVNQTSTGMNKFGLIAQQTGYQVSDFIVQVQSGTNPLVAFSQQATQLSGLLYELPPRFMAAKIGIMGFSVGMSAIVAGITIGIPLLAMLAMNFFSSGEKADKAAKGVDRYKQALDGLKSATEAVQTDINKVTFGIEDTEIANARQAMRDAQAELQKLQADAMRTTARGVIFDPSGEQKAAIAEAQEGYRNLTIDLNNLLFKQTALNEAQNMLNGGLSVAADIQKNIAYWTEVQLRLKKEAETIKSTVTEGVSDPQKNLDIQKEYQRLLQAGVKPVEAMAKAQYQVERALIQSSLASGKLNNEQSLAAKAAIVILDTTYALEKNLRQSAAETKLLEQGISQSVIDALKLQGVDLSNLSAGALSAAAMASNLGISLGLATEIERLSKMSPEEKFIRQGVKTGALPREALNSLDGQTGFTTDANAPIEIPGVMTPNPDRPKKDTGGGGGKGDPLEELRQQIKLENELLGVSEAQARVIQALGMDRSKYSQAEINAITAEIEAYNQKQEAIERTKEIMDTVKSSMEDAFMSMVDGTKSAKDAFKDMAAMIIKELYRVLVVQQLVGGIASAFGGGGGGSFFTAPSTGSFGLPFGGPMASGGPVDANKVYLVGEQGPELVIPKEAGTVVNAVQTAKAINNLVGEKKPEPVVPKGFATVVKATEKAKAVDKFIGKSSKDDLGVLFGGARATGGPIESNKAYLVGERGPELVIPRQSGTVVNAAQTAQAMGSGSGDVTVNNNITVTGSDAAMVRTEIAKMIPQITNATKAAVIDAKQRGGQMAAAFR